MKVLFASVTICAALIAATVAQASSLRDKDKPLLVPLVKGPAQGLAEAHYQTARCAALYMDMSNLVGTNDPTLADKLDAKGKTPSS
jgi:hypothetical protein